MRTCDGSDGKEKIKLVWPTKERRVMDIIVFILNIARYNNNDRYKGERKITIEPRKLNY